MRRILYIDDTIVFLDLVKTYFEVDGDHEVTVTKSIAEARSILKLRSFDFIISGYSSETDGIELLTEMRERGENTPFIIFFNWETDKMFDQAMVELSPNAVVYKVNCGLQLDLLNKSIMMVTEKQQTANSSGKEMPLYLRPTPCRPYRVHCTSPRIDKTDETSRFAISGTTNVG